MPPSGHYLGDREASSGQMVWNWTVRLALPLLLGVLAAALHAMWTEAPYAPGVLDILGTLGIIVTMLGMVVWCACAWLGSEGEPPRRGSLSSLPRGLRPF
jgi:hypothetical protein